MPRSWGRSRAREARAPLGRPCYDREMSRLPSLGSRGEGWVAIQFGLLGAIGLAALAGPSWDGLLRSLTTVAGFGLAIAGLAMAMLGLRDLGANLTPLPYPRAAARLVETGIYARVRHPIYGGIVVGGLGWSLATASVVGLLLEVVLFWFFILKSRREEAWLTERFPAYPDYRSRTHALIPFVF